MSEAPYSRGWSHGKERGQEAKVNCDFCGKMTPRWKCFPVMRGFRINDPVIRQQIDRRHMSMWERKQMACPACARFRGIVQMGKSRKTRAVNQPQY